MERSIATEHHPPIIPKRSIDRRPVRSPLGSTPSASGSLTPQQRSVNGHAVQPSSAIAIPAKPSNAPPQRDECLLLIAVAASTEQSFHTHVETLFARLHVTQVSIIGLRSYESQLKNVKNNVYGLAGRLRREVGVQIYPVDDLRGAALEDAVVGALKEGDAQACPLGAVLCDPATGLLEHGQVHDAFALHTEDLEATWAPTVGFVYTLARLTRTRLCSREHLSRQEGRKNDAAAYFVVATGSKEQAATSMHGAGITVLLHSLEQAADEGRLVAGYAKDVLIPDPEPAHGTNGSLLAPTDAWNTYSTNGTPSESPTKLWNMWALQDEIQNFE